VVAGGTLDLKEVTLNPESLIGPQKAAILLLAMGEEFSSRIIKKLDEDDIKKLGEYMSQITFIPSDVLNRVVNEFIDKITNDINVAVSGKEFIKQIVSKTLDDETANEILKLLGDKKNYIPFEDLNHIPADQVYKLIKNEHPQTIALILSYINQDKAAQILRLFPDELKYDIILRIVKMDQVQDDIIRELDETLKQDLTNVKVSRKNFDGIEAVANILNGVDRETEEKLLSKMDEEHSDLAEKIRQKMFVFEDLLYTDDRSFRTILQNVDNQTVAKALKTASEEMHQKVFSNLSERAAEMLKEDMEVMGPVRISEVEQAQQTIVKIAKKLEDEGKIVLGGKGKEGDFV